MRSGVVGLVVTGLVMAGTASAQQVARDYQPPSGEAVETFFARLQSSDPVVERPGLRWRHDGVWWRWEPIASATAPGLTPISPANCQHVSPYVDPLGAMQCAEQGEPERPLLATYSVGARYQGAYPNMRMTVLALTRSLDGVEIVTYQWLSASRSPEGQQAGDVSACRNDGGRTATSCSVWMLAQRD